MGAALARDGRQNRRVIGHLDLDTFFAAVELHRRPELRNRPMVVGGDPDGRGVVATASYAARKFGIRSAMSCAEARRRCPEVVFVPPDIPHYREWSRRVWELVGSLSPCVEQLGMDEGYLILDDPGDGAPHAHQIQQALRDTVRLSCSIGVGTCKVVAKIASDRDKPAGITVVAPGQEAEFLASLPLRALPGVGPRTDERLAAVGVTTIGGLAGLDDDALAVVIPGQFGQELRSRARGIDPREVSAEPAERISVSMERTFDRDVTDRGELVRWVERWSQQLADHLTGNAQAGRTVNIKLRYPDFQTLTRARTLPGPTADAETIADTAVELLDRALAERRGPIRLLGVGVSGMASHEQLTLFALGASTPVRTASSGLHSPD